MKHGEKSRGLRKTIKILLVHTGGLGDLIMARPTIHAIHAAYPLARLDFLGNSFSMKILEKDSLIENYIAFDSNKKKLSRVVPMFATLLKLRMTRYNYLFLLQPVLSKSSQHRLYFLVKMIQAGKTFGRKNPFGRDLCDESFQERAESHEVDRMLGVAALAGIAPAPSNNYLLTYTFKRSGLDNNLPAKPYAVISPGASRSFRMWPIQNFLTIAKKFQDIDMEVVLVGTKDEYEQTKATIKQFPINTVVLMGKTNLDELCAVIQTARIVLANNSGPMHIANALGTPLVAINSSGDSTRTRPYLTDKTVIVDSNDRPCKPCYRQVCHTPLCMEDITVERVWEKVMHLLNDQN